MMAKGDSELFSKEAAEQAEENEKRELKQLFGESAANIAGRTNLPDKSSASAPAATEVEFDIKRLVNGMQQLEWGTVRLIDVNLANDGMLETTVAPLLEPGTWPCSASASTCRSACLGRGGGGRAGRGGGGAGGRRVAGAAGAGAGAGAAVAAVPCRRKSSSRMARRSRAACARAI